MIRKVIITGIGGYIGSIAASMLLARGVTVVGIDNFSKGYPQPIYLLQKKYGKDRLRFYKADIRDDLSHIFAQEKQIDAVLHYAALCDVNESMQNPFIYFDTNVRGTNNLIETMLRYDVTQIVFSSTCAVYGNVKKVPVDETHPTKPLSPYGTSKLMAEEVIRTFGETRGLRYVIFRYFNVTGATDDGLIGDSKKPSSLLVQNAVRGAMGIEPFQTTFSRVETADGSPIRDFIHVVDLNEAHIKGIEYLLAGRESTLINLGTGKGSSVMEVIKAVESVTKKRILVTRGIERQGDIAEMFAITTKAEKLLGWKAKRTLRDAVLSLQQWYLHHPYGWGDEKREGFTIRRVSLPSFTKRNLHRFPRYFIKQTSAEVTN